MAIRTTGEMPREAWGNIGITYDGSATAEGMNIFINGKPAGTEIVRDHLYKSPQNGSTGFNFGARFRSFGLKDGMMDELSFYQWALAPLEVAQLFDGQALADAIATRNADALRSVYLAAFDDSVKEA